MLFGVATADHQCEAYDPRYADVRDLWEVRRGETLRGRATDFWNRYPEDIALAKSLGCTAFRFSIAWARVEPGPGEFNAEALDHYAKMVADVRAAGLEPIVTLHHNTHPVHVEERGGLIGAQFPALFSRYASRVAAAFGDSVTYWVTLNEPTQLVYGYVKPWWSPAYLMPPGLPRGASTGEQMSAVATLIPNLFRAHAQARAAVRAVNPNARVGTNPLLLGLPLWLQTFVDARATRLRSVSEVVAQGARLVERGLLEHGAADLVIATMTPTPDRKSELAFSLPYFTTGLVAFVPAASPIATAGALAGKTIGVVRDSTARGAVPHVLVAADSAAFATYPQMFAALRAGSIDAALGDRILLEGYAAREGPACRALAPDFSAERYAVAGALGNNELMELTDAAIAEFIASGAWQRSATRHFAGPVAPPPGRPVAPPPRTRAAHSRVLAAIEKRGYLRVAVKDDVPGMALRDPQTGELQGLEIDLARAVAAHIFGDPARVRFSIVRTGKRTGILRSFARFFAPLAKIAGLLSTVVAANWWHLGMAGRLPPFLCPPECVGTQDYVGFDYYWGIPALGVSGLSRLLDAATGRYARAPVWPAVLFDFLKFHARLFPGKEIFVIENGCVDAADGVAREEYLRRHLHEVQRALDQGVNVRAYVCWSITSNREWGLKFDANSDFGLFHIDLDTDPQLVRRPTAASASYRELIAGFRSARRS